MFKTMAYELPPQPPNAFDNTAQNMWNEIPKIKLALSQQTEPATKWQRFRSRLGRIANDLTKWNDETPLEDLSVSVIDDHPTLELVPVPRPESYPVNLGKVSPALDMVLKQDIAASRARTPRRQT